MVCEMMSVIADSMLLARAVSVAEWNLVVAAPKLRAQVNSEGV